MGIAKFDMTQGSAFESTLQRIIILAKVSRDGVVCERQSFCSPDGQEIWHSICQIARQGGSTRMPYKRSTLQWPGDQGAF